MRVHREEGRACMHREEGARTYARPVPTVSDFFFVFSVARYGRSGYGQA